jgi:SAM-dependent methyltransferase
MPPHAERTAVDYYNAVPSSEDFDRGRLGRDDEHGMQWQADLVREWAARIGALGHAVEIGCGKGPLRATHPKYRGLDISIVGLAQFGGSRVVGSAESLPFRTQSVPFLFTFAALEHVPNPELAFEEIARVLAPRGVAIVAPAWFCRDWAAKGLPVKRYSELPLRDKIAKALIPLRNNLLWRLLWTMPARIARELRYSVNGGATKFTYRRLNPNLDEYVYTDCDAFTSMDPHTAILYFVSRGFRVIGRDTFAQRMRVRHEPLIVERPR